MLADTFSSIGYFLVVVGVLLGIYKIFIVQNIDNGRFKLKLGTIPVVIMIVMGIFLASIQNIVFYAEPGYSYLVQYPSGTQKAILTPGFHMRWFGETIPFKKSLTVAFVGPEDPVDFSGMRPTQTILFNDSVKAHVRMTARFQLPENEAPFLQMALAYRTQKNLVNSSLVPILQESMRNSGRMFSAQEYIGGKGGDFENAVLDQIRNGIYLLDIKEERVFSGEVDAIDESGPTIQQDQTVRVIVSVRHDDEGQILRKDAKDHPLQKYNLLLVQASIQDVDPDDAFKEKLKEQRDAAAQVAIERQKTRQAEERKKRVQAEGEAEKTEGKIQEEKKQIEEITRSETDALKAEQDKKRRAIEVETAKLEHVANAEAAKEVAQLQQEKRQIELETAKLEKVAVAEAAKAVAEVQREQKLIELETTKLEAEQIRVLAQAQAERRKAIFEADNALEQRLDAWVKVSQAYAAALKNNQLVPTVQIGGDDGQGRSASDFISLLIANTAQELSLKLEETNTTQKK